MSCEKIKEQLPLYVLDELSASEKTEIETHLKSCENCRQELDEFREIINELSEAKDTNVAEDENIHIKNIIYKSVLQSAVQSRPSKSIMTYIVQTAAAILIFLSGYFVSSYYTETFQPVHRYTINQNEVGLSQSFKTYKNSKMGLKIIAKGKMQLATDSK